jgi:hypothetical protein
LFGKTLSGVSGFRVSSTTVTPTAQLFNESIKFFCAFAFTVAGKDRLILLIIIVNCRLFVHSKLHRTNQYRICCLFHFFFIYVVSPRIYTKISLWLKAMWNNAILPVSKSRHKESLPL